MLLLTIPVVIGGIYLSIFVGYNLFFVISSFFMRNEPVNKHPGKLHKILVIIPAYNEELFLSRILDSLQKSDYPAEYHNVVVVADNCTDSTAKIAFSYEVMVLERQSKDQVGKGYAIKHAIDNVFSTGVFDAIFIVDADSIVHRDCLHALNDALNENDTAIQCYNGVGNPGESWFTRLLNVSRTISNEILEPAKDKFGLSSHLMGNGMCIHRKIIDRFGWNAFSVGEDWEYFAKIIQDGGRIAFSVNGRVYHQESSTLKQATSQRMRWSSGRFKIIWQYGINVFFRELASMNLRRIDSTMPLLLPNPSLGINLTMVGFLGSLIILWQNGTSELWLWFLTLIVAQMIVFLAGICKTKDKWQSFLSFFIAPVFLIWKMGIDLLSFFGLGQKKWVRTKRKKASGG